MTNWHEWSWISWKTVSKTEITSKVNQKRLWELLSRSSDMRQKNKLWLSKLRLTVIKQWMVYFVMIGKAQPPWVIRSLTPPRALICTWPATLQPQLQQGSPSWSRMQPPGLLNAPSSCSHSRPSSQPQRPPRVPPPQVPRASQPFLKLLYVPALDETSLDSPLKRSYTFFYSGFHAAQAVRARAERCPRILKAPAPLLSSWMSVS